MMERYRNARVDSGVSVFERGLDYIKVKFYWVFRDNSYSFSRTGRNHVEQMKVLALTGNRLNSYLKRQVKHLYD